MKNKYKRAEKRNKTRNNVVADGEETTYTFDWDFSALFFNEFDARAVLCDGRSDCAKLLTKCRNKFFWINLGLWFK